MNLFLTTQKAFVFVFAFVYVVPVASSLRTRQLQGDGIRDFRPLTCNTNLASAPCSTWSSVFGTSISHATRITIPCGQCITMNHIGSVELLGGLDVIGKLVVPDGYNLNLASTMIVVQGELQMTSSKAVDGVPAIRCTMIGNDNSLTFTPVDVNANACKGISTCSIGKKAIIVAGGKVTINGLPTGTPTWTRLYNATGGTFNNPDTILVPDTVVGKWAPGAQILITSHTRLWNDQRERTIVRVTPAAVSGFVALTLNASILRPTTIVESPDFAVEVALLSRNIVFESGSDTTVSHGGHFMVMNTPSVVQTIEGIEFKNFGQQGVLGRYPVHFHFCSDVAGSIVAKNSIRQSHQRCVVVHGTNKLRVEENVAFDTKGHCFMTEDGIETGNEFIRNLGAQTDAPLTIIPDNGFNGAETDRTPATFWINNPSNSWLGNVAAGSVDSGFWFEPKLRGVRAYLFPNYDPQVELLGLFKDNVVHSNSGRLGAIRTYVPGYRPTEMVAFDGLKVYRNKAPGIQVHRCQNIHITNGLFADNSIGIDIDRAEGIEVSNTTVIGESKSYKDLRARQSVEATCSVGRITGIDLYTWKVEKAWAGAKLSNVELSGFGPVVGCVNPASIKFDVFTLKQGLFEFYTSFRNVTLHDGPGRIDMCIINREEFKMLYIVDLDGTMRPSTVATQSLSTLVASDDRELLKFVDPSKCTNVTAGCYQYCSGSCFRSVRYTVTGPGQESYKLKVCLRNEYSRCSFFPGGRRDASGPHTYMAHLPVGNEYDAVFLDGLGQEIAPTAVLRAYEESFCAVDSVFDVTLYGRLPTTAPIAPPPSPIAEPIAIPVNVPVVAPVSVPVEAPIAFPVEASGNVPVVAPVSFPVEAPVSVPDASGNVPLAAPMFDPVESPFAAPVAVPMDAPASAPFPIVPPSIFSGLFLIQTNTGQESPLSSTITLSSTGTSLSIVAKTTGTSVKKVTFKFDGPLIQTELMAPWALKGDRAGKYISYAPLAVRGSHTVVAEAFSSTGSSVGTISQTLTVV